MSLSPFFRSPFTDFSPAILNRQWDSNCADLELQALDCLEAYGLDKGKRVCRDVLADFQECALRTKQNKRTEAMMKERDRQYRTGERTRENRYAAPPKVDSY